MSALAPAAASNGSQSAEPFYFPLLPTLNGNTVEEQARNYGNAQYDHLSIEARQAATNLVLGSKNNPLQVQSQRIGSTDVSVLVLVGKLYNAAAQQSTLPGFVKDVLRLPCLPTVIPTESVGEMVDTLASFFARPERVKAVVYAGHAGGSGGRFEFCPDGVVSGSFRHDLLPMATFAALAIHSPTQQLFFLPLACASVGADIVLAMSNQMGDRKETVVATFTSAAVALKSDKTSLSTGSRCTFRKASC
jgi:hypothetical protein